MASVQTPISTTREKLQRARAAAPEIANLSTAQKNAALREMASRIEARQDEILGANRRDLEESGLSGPMQDRLLLTPERVAAMAEGIRAIVALEDPVGRTLAEWSRPDGLHFRKVTVPLGVIGIIYESRPNVTADAAALAFKAGNAVVLRGGREAAHSNEVLVEILAGVPGVPEGGIELLDSSSRQSVEELIRARDCVDLIVPRGGAGLISFVAENSRVPVIETGAGNCHIFVDESADLEMADRIILNAKTSRPSVCNAAEKILIHRNIAAAYVPRIVRLLRNAGVEVRGDDQVRLLAGGEAVLQATPEDWFTEYLDLRICAGIVADLPSAIEHINRYSTKHSESIITADEEHAREFQRRVDSAAVYWNASTRFTDGGEFGFGAEMGISTQKLHARGPFALPELTSIKYEITGSGQIRT